MTLFSVDSEVLGTASMRSYSELSTLYIKSVRELVRSTMEVVNCGLAAVFRKCDGHNSVSGNSRRECPDYGVNRGQYDIARGLFSKPENAFYRLCDILNFPEKSEKFSFSGIGSIERTRTLTKIYFFCVKGITCCHGNIASTPCLLKIRLLKYFSPLECHLFKQEIVLGLEVWGLT